MIGPRMAAREFATAGDRLQSRVEIGLLNRGLSFSDSAWREASQRAWLRRPMTIRMG